jgi:hypothetical protein
LLLSFLKKNTFAANSLAFLLKGNALVKLTADVQVGLVGSGKDADSFISEVQAAVASECTDGASLLIRTSGVIHSLSEESENE